MASRNASQDLVPGNIAQHLVSGSAASDIALGTAGWMDADHASRKLGFDTQLFKRNRHGLFEGRSNGQVWLGEAFGSTESLGFADDRHVCLVSGSRGGKGTGVIIPNLAL